MTTSRCKRFAVSSALLVALCGHDAGAQTFSNRGFADGSVFAFPEEAPNDRTRLVGDALFRDEAFVKAASWLQLSGGIELRANSHDQVDTRWRVDFSDRTIQRPALSIRRLAATITARRVTIDVGKQFVRWGKTDILNPTDRFAPRDFINVVDTELIAITAARAVVEFGSETIDVVWVPRFTPSRTPLPDQRWTVVPPAASVVSLIDRGAVYPARSQVGIRWGHVAPAGEFSFSFFDGFNHLPNVVVSIRPLPSFAAPAPFEVSVTRTYPSLRVYGGDAAVPTRWFTIKGEAAYFTSDTTGTDEYVLYVVQLERQQGEWVFVGGYAGEAVAEARAARTFAPDRGLTRAIVGRAAYTIDPNRSVAFEAAVRQNGRGMYAKTEYSQAHGQHWRTTAMAVAIAGKSDDFLGQYHRNSHASLSIRYSF